MKPKRTSPESALARRLLRFAIQRITQSTNELADSHMDPRTARIKPASVAKEVRANYEWLRKARKAVRA